MAAVSLTEPLCKPCSYRSHFKGNAYLFNNSCLILLHDPLTGYDEHIHCSFLGCWMFTVELCVRKPLMPIHLSSDQVALEMLCLCSQLDLLIRAQVHQVRAEIFKHWIYMCVCLNIQTSNLHEQFQEQIKQDTSPEESESFKRQGKL